MGDLFGVIEGVTLDFDVGGEVRAEGEMVDGVCEGVLLRAGKVLVEVVYMHLCA